MYYNPSHVRTICKLQKLTGDNALRFGVDFSDEAPEEPHKGSHISLELYQELMKNDHTYRGKKIWFEVYLDGKYHRLTYYTYEHDFHIGSGVEQSEALKELTGSFGGSYYGMSGSYHEVQGFDGLAVSTPPYRDGIVLAVFSNLVCDLLGVERIKEVY